jgi:hypothetical protein
MTTQQMIEAPMRGMDCAECTGTSSSDEELPGVEKAVMQLDLLQVVRRHFATLRNWNSSARSNRTSRAAGLLPYSPIRSLHQRPGQSVLREAAHVMITRAELECESLC